jgi:hypothetical protein
MLTIIRHFRNLLLDSNVYFLIINLWSALTNFPLNLPVADSAASSFSGGGLFPVNWKGEKDFEFLSARFFTF